MPGVGSPGVGNISAISRRTYMEYAHTRSFRFAARAVVATATRQPLAIGRDQWASTTPIHKSRRFRGDVVGRAARERAVHPAASLAAAEFCWPVSRARHSLARARCLAPGDAASRFAPTGSFLVRNSMMYSAVSWRFITQTCHSPSITK